MFTAKRPVVITALKSKAHVLRRVASEHNLSYEERSVPGENDLVKFFFEELDAEKTKAFVFDVPREVYAFRGVM
ncbi:hypothetical protein [Solimonas marina]|uniref:Uncharacterized protein n=1 Tax=Solimonas marina TaxID=2714601 RepID=A0A969WBG7_9GAMM|nr:hypothetical protein [Solimonas marina]NKF24107.1 hypothetical protein [Solimonas marina]